MYGTVARMQLKPGMEERMRALADEEGRMQIPGFVSQYLYQMDGDPHEFYLAVVFDSKEAYVANANSPEQHARYLHMIEMLEAEPEWHDGEIMYSWSRS